MANSPAQEPSTPKEATVQQVAPVAAPGPTYDDGFRDGQIAGRKRIEELVSMVRTLKECSGSMENSVSALLRLWAVGEILEAKRITFASPKLVTLYEMLERFDQEHPAE